WTSDRNEFLSLVNQQQAYVGEGVAAFVMPYINAQGQVSPQVTGSIPFYRAAFQGRNLHFWTSDVDEYNSHLPPGYLPEGIASYILPASGAQFSSALPQRTVPEDDSPDIVSAVGSAIAPGQALTFYGHRLAGTVKLNGFTAQVISAKDNQITVLVPKELAGS